MRYLREDGRLFHEKLCVLHIAPERGLEKRLRELRNLEYTTADLYAPNVDVRFDLTAIPFPDGMFDMIMCVHVLEHIPDDIQALRDLLRVLRPGGLAILQSALNPNFASTHEDPSITSPQNRLLHFEGPDHYRIYGRDFGDRVRSVGFHVAERPVAITYSRKAIFRFGLDKTETLYICTKPD